MPTKTQLQSRLFCFPYAGGGVSIYRSWPSKLPPEVEVRPIQLPGRENRIRETPFTQLMPLIQELASALKPYLDMPFSFFGHSMGALISFELARYLRRNQLSLPAHLFLSAHRAPQIPHHKALLHTMPDTELIDTLHSFGGTPEAVLQHTELMRMLLPVLRADFTIYETYVYAPEPPLTCPITIFGGKQDQEVSLQELAAWREQTQSEFALKLLPGNHFFLHSYQDLLLQAIAQDLF